ncbi:MAG: branched-chain amino acid transaminase [Deltaproteobacteria bacterium]|nr:branched-chain amino acid transaminase [Deltaproteobacteria bacterium]
MQPTKLIWMNGKLTDWQQANVHVLTHALHYGSGAFEGIRVYKTPDGPAVFRLKEHIERLYYSSSVLSLNIPFKKEELCKGVVDLLRENGLEQGYIRPLAFFGYGVMGLNPRGGETNVIIACWPWGAYLPHDSINIKISKYIRIHPQSTVADAKLCGHYVNSIMAALEVRGTQYHEALFLDYKGEVAEGPGENFFMIKGNELITPPLGAILAGITRDTVMQIAQASGYKVTERPIKAEEIYTADEAFFTGTAAEVTPIGSINDKPLGAGGVGPISGKIKQAYLDVVYGKNPEYKHMLTYVS